MCDRYGLPVAIGAALAEPDRPVLCLESDGSAMYTISALWTHARERLDITTVVYANHAYDILRVELQRVGASAPDHPPGPSAESLLDLTRPTLDFVQIAEGMGSRPDGSARPRNSPMRWRGRSPSRGRT